MSIPGTVQITGPLAPTATSDTFGTHSDKYGIGGYRVAADHTERNAITAERREAGMMVYTNSDGAKWILAASPWNFDDTDWAEDIGGGDKNFAFAQASPSATWIIAHGLGKFPSVTVVDSAGEEVDGLITYDSADQLTLDFSAAFSGTAYLN